MKHTVSMKENYLFRRLYAKGKSAATAALAVYVRPNHSQRTRLGITVSAKLGKAVRRNRVRRRIREAYRLGRGPLRTFLDANPSVRTLSMAFIYMCDKNLPYSTIERKMQLLLKKAVDRLNAR